MNKELIEALQALSAISAKDTRIGSSREVLRLFQRIQRMVANTDRLTCEVDARLIRMCLAMYFYPEGAYESKYSFYFSISKIEIITTYQNKKRFFNELSEFIDNIKNYYNEREQPDPTRANILP